MSILQLQVMACKLQLCREVRKMAKKIPKKKRDQKVSDILAAFDNATEQAKIQIMAFMEGYNFRKEVEGRKPE